MALMICPECGKEISESAVTCPFCGYPLREKLRDAETLKKSQEREAEAQQIQREREAAKQEKKAGAGSKKWLAVVAAAVCLALVAVGAFAVIPSLGKGDLMAAYRDAAPGDLIVFGSYEQDNDLTNGQEPIEWLVLARDGNRALLLSKYGLDAQPYNEEIAHVTWETCTLRAWLNDDFLNRAFTAEEQRGIVRATVTADKNPSFDTTDPGNDTRDRVFLLSIEEFEALFATDEARICKPTAYAGEQGAHMYDSGACFWWLRSPGNNQRRASLVLGVGVVDRYGDGVRNVLGAVRPALWVNLES